MCNGVFTWSALSDLRHCHREGSAGPQEHTVILGPTLLRELPRQHQQRHQPFRDHRSGLLHAMRKSSRDKSPTFWTTAYGMQAPPARPTPPAIRDSIAASL